MLPATHPRRTPAPGAACLLVVCLVAALAAPAHLSADPVSERTASSLETVSEVTATEAAPHAAPCSARDAMDAMQRVERRILVMGTLLDLVVEAPTRREALAAGEAVLGALQAAEARLSTWNASSERDGSDLTRLLRAPVGEPVEIDPLLHRDLAAALRCHDLTGGAFDPTVGPLVAAWDLRGAGRVPTDAEIRHALDAVSVGGLRLSSTGDGTHRAVRRQAGLSIEEGGFGKGAGLGDALRALHAFPGVRARLDLGGQLAFLGPAGDETHWTVEVAHPAARHEVVAAFRADGGSVSTTGNGERGLLVGGRHVGHVLDPRTGRPAPDFGSLTVWSEDPLLADCLSTGLYVLGPDAALDRAGAIPGVEALVATHDGIVRATSGLRASLERRHPPQASPDTARPSSRPTRNAKGAGPSRSRSGPPPF